jgi:hypothetical protein
MGLSLTHRTRDAHASQERVERLIGYTASPAPDGSDDPEPFCAARGAPIGIFLRLGLDWRHFRQSGAAVQADRRDRDGAAVLGEFEVFDPGHEPVVAWRLTGDAAMRL